MKIFRYSSLVPVLLALTACGGDAPDNTATQAAGDRAAVTTEPNAMQSHTISGMKKALNDARAVEGMLQQHHEQQRRAIDEQSR